MVGHHAVLIYESTPTMTPDAETRWLRRFYNVKDSQTLVPIVSWPGDREAEYDTVLECDELSDTALE